MGGVMITLLLSSLLAFATSEADPCGGLDPVALPTGEGVPIDAELVLLVDRVDEDCQTEWQFELYTEDGVLVHETPVDMLVYPSNQLRAGVPTLDPSTTYQVRASNQDGLPDLEWSFTTGTETAATPTEAPDGSTNRNSFWATRFSRSDIRYGVTLSLAPRDDGLTTVEILRPDTGEVWAAAHPAEESLWADLIPLPAQSVEEDLCFEFRSRAINGSTGPTDELCGPPRVHTLKGCATVAGSPAPWWILMGLGVVGLRRRRR